MAERARPRERARARARALDPLRSLPRARIRPAAERTAAEPTARMACRHALQVLPSYAGGATLWSTAEMEKSCLQAAWAAGRGRWWMESLQEVSLQERPHSRRTRHGVRQGRLWWKATARRLGLRHCRLRLHPPEEFGSLREVSIRFWPLPAQLYSALRSGSIEAPG